MAKKDQLTNQLNAYSATVRNSRSLGQRIGNWSIYAAAAGSALAMATSASANIIDFVPVNPITVTPDLQHPNPFIALTFNNLNGTLGGQSNQPGGSVVFQLNTGKVGSTYFGSALLFGANGAKIFGTATGGSVGRFAAKNFGAGAAIGGAGTSAAGIANLRLTQTYAGNSIYGNFQSGQIGYAGFQLANGDLGWLKISFSDSVVFQGGNPVPFSITLYEAAVETDGARGSITAGELPAAPQTPEPGTMALSLLASGAVGVIAWKRRRKLSATSSVPQA